VIRALLRSPLFRGLVTAAILIYLATRIDMGDAAAAMLRVPVRVLVAVMTLVAIDRTVMIARWILILRSTRINISVRSAAGIYLVSSFLGNFLLAGVGAEAMRAWSLGRRTSENSEAVASVAVDRLLGLLSIVMLGALGAIAWTGDSDRRLERPVIIVAVLVFAGSIAMLWADRVLRAIVPKRWLASRAGGAFLRLVDAVGRYRGRRGTIVVVLALSIVVQWLRIAQAWLLGVGLGIAVPFRYYLVFMPIGLLALLLPVSVGGFGFPQGVIVWLLHPRGVPDAQSFALSTLINLTGLAGNLPGMLLYLRSKGSPEPTRS
jgi:uncharacterized protein (TIRG00374 family)